MRRQKVRVPETSQVTDVIQNSKRTPHWADARSSLADGSGFTPGCLAQSRDNLSLCCLESLRHGLQAHDHPCCQRYPGLARGGLDREICVAQNSCMQGASGFWSSCAGRSTCQGIDLFTVVAILLGLPYRPRLVNVLSDLECMI